MFWHEAELLIRKAMERGDLGKFSEVERMLKEGNALLWISADGVAVTHLEIVESGKVCTIVACGGLGIVRGISAIHDIENYAREMGCKSVRIMGRKGWAKVLTDYRTTKIVLEKEL